MFSHKNLALLGLFPGLVTHRSVANLGHFEIEVIVKPVQPTTTGGGSGWLHPIKDHEVTVRITRHGKTWETTYVTSKYFADKAITVNAWLIGLRKLMENISVKITKLGINIRSIIVKGRKL